MMFETKPTKRVSPCYYARASWQARPEIPDELAARFLRQIDQLVATGPLFELWTCGATRPKKFETVRDHYAEEVAAGLSKDDWGEPVPVEGYGFGAITRGQPPSRSYAVLVIAGAHMRIQAEQNSAQFSTSSMAAPDPEAITYRIFRSALHSLIDCWDPVEVCALPQALLEHADKRAHFCECWMQYLAAPLATLVTPPSSAIVEHLPGGGLLMSATTETFSVDNTAHLAVAHDIAEAIAPLNELPYVTDRGYQRKVR